MNWIKQLVDHRRRARGLKDLPLNQARLVVVDVETTGLDTERDDLLSIGAVVVQRRCVDLSQQFERTLRQPTSGRVGSILIHGITPTELARGQDPKRALTDFLEFVGHSPVFAFHAPFDRRVLRRAVKKHLGSSFDNPFLDLADIAPALLADIAPARAGLDEWLQACGLQVSERHHAAADALATAELLLVVLQRAHRMGLTTLGELMAKTHATRQLEHMRLPH